VKDPVTVAEYASWNEFGVRNKANTGWKIPPRSFLRSTIDERQQEYVLRLSNLISAAIGENANGDDAETIVGKLAESAVGDVKQKIVRLRTPPNAPYTIRKKKSTNPLIDTGRLLNSIVHKIVKE
jgi:phage gpG-like protein